MALENQPTSSKTKQANTYLKYAGLAFQMGGIIAVCALLGQYIDKRMALSTPWFTVFLSLFGVLGALFSTLKQLLKDS